MEHGTPTATIGAITKTDNVVIMKVHNHPDGNRDVLGAPSVQSDTVGKGKVTIYRDGTKITGNWRRTQGLRSAPLHRRVGQTDRAQAGPDLGGAAAAERT